MSEFIIRFHGAALKFGPINDTRGVMSAVSDAQATRFGSSIEAAAAARQYVLKPGAYQIVPAPAPAPVAPGPSPKPARRRNQPWRVGFTIRVDAEIVVHARTKREAEQKVAASRLKVGEFAIIGCFRKPELIKQDETISVP